MHAETTSHAQNDVTATLRGMGFPEGQILRAFAGGHDTVEKAIDYLTSNPVAHVKQNSASSSSNTRTGGATSTGATATSAAPIDVDDPDLQRALVASEQEARTVKAKTGDEDLERAIAASLKDSTPARVSWPDELVTHPERRVRPDMSTPVGLRNIGNTCYLNSLLQVYFHLPSFRRAVLSYRQRATDEPLVTSGFPVAPIVTGIEGDPVSGSSSDAAAVRAKERAAHAQEFMVELQRLFAQMALGNQSIVDPSALIRAMRDPDGKQIEIGGQEDAAEFNQIFLDMVQLAVAPEKERASGEDEEMKTGAETASANPASLSESEPDRNFVRTLFTTNFKQEVVLATVDATGTSSTSISEDDSGVQKPAVVSRTGETSSFFIDATTEDNRELYHGLDDYAQTRIEYIFDAPEEAPKANHVTPVKASQEEPMCIVSLNESSDKMKIDTVSTDTTIVDSVQNLSKPAVKSEWFTDLAPVLTVYLQRVRFNRKTASTEKVHEKYLFDTELAMDRYLDKNRVESERARRKVARIHAKRLETEEKLNGILHFPGTKPPPRTFTTAKTDISRSSVIRPVMIGPLEQKDADLAFQVMDDSGASQDDEESTNDYFTALDRVKKRLAAARDSKSPYFVDKLSKSAISNALKLLEKLETEDRVLKTSLKERVDALAIEESKCYEALRTMKYQLWAVLVHDGAPASGHYLVFIRSGSREQDGKSRWMRFSDVSMTYVTEDEMLQWSIGGHGYASAYCLIYASSSQIPTTQSQPEGEEFLEECRRLLPQERLDEVYVLKAAFDQELLDYRVKVQKNNAQAKARSIVEMATAQLRAATMNDTAMTGRSSDAGSVGMPPLRIRSIVEFCLSAKTVYHAIGLALEMAWSAHESGITLFDVVRKSIRTKQGYPPLVGSSSPKATLATDLDVLKLQEVFSIMRLQKVAPPLGSEDSPFLSLAEAKHMPDVLETKLETLEDRMNKARVMYKFALRSTGLATCAMAASFRGAWESALWLWYHLSKPRHVIGPRDNEERLVPIVKDFIGRSIYGFARHDALYELVAPTVLVAASEDAAERIRLGSADGHAAAIFVAEHSLRMFPPHNPIFEYLIQDWENYLHGWRTGQSATNLHEKARQTASNVINILKTKQPNTINARIVPIDPEVQSRMEEACANPAGTAFGFNKVREQVVGLGLVASDGPSLRRAATQLRTHVMGATEQ